MSVLELVINLVGGIMFLVVGGLSISHNAIVASKRHDSSLVHFVADVNTTLPLI